MRSRIAGAVAVLVAFVAGCWTTAGGVKAMSQEQAVYVVAQIQIDDRETYGRYEAGFGAIFERYEGELLSVSEDPELIEGEWSYTRTVLLRFPSSAALHAWYDSADYQELARHRWAASRGNIVAVPGR
ncbi:MAG: DUF1330 domain-containing protein [Acidobacteriota bacterium]